MNQQTTFGMVSWLISVVSFWMFATFALTVPIGKALDSRTIMLIGTVGAIAVGFVFCVSLFLRGHPAGTGPRWMQKRRERQADQGAQ